METVREAWTDERLDDLNARVERGFDRVDADLRELRVEMNARFARVDDRFDRLEARFDAMQRTMITAMGAMLVGFSGVIAAVLGT